MTIATLLGLLFAVYVWEWSLASGLIFGLCLSCASTVVLLKALEMHGHLNTVDGQISVGWLVVEDIATVLILVLLPPIAQIMGVAPGGSEAAEPMTASGIAYVIASTLLHVVAFVGHHMVVGPQVHPLGALADCQDGVARTFHAVDSHRFGGNRIRRGGGL